jgi:hypothetical protein
MQLAAFAPDIIKLLTGNSKAGEVAGKVVDIARTVTGIDDPATIVTTMQMDPGKAAEFQLAMAEKQGELEKAYLADAQNARAMQVAALGQEDMFSKRFIYYFIAAWSLFTMAYVAAITFWPPIEESGKANSATVLGFLLGTAVASIFSYLFGSTKSSADKNRLLASVK